MFITLPWNVIKSNCLWAYKERTSEKTRGEELFWAALSVLIYSEDNTE